MRRMMREDHLDAIVLSRNVNVFYATGSRFVFIDRDGPNALTPQSCAVVTHETDVYCQRFGPFDTDEVAQHTTWSPHLELYTDELELVLILKDFGVGHGARVGIEWGPKLCTGINPIKYEALRQRVARELGAEFADSTTTICKVMAVKSAVEIERMKVSVAAASRATSRILKVVELGMKEVDIARTLRRFMLEEGADGASNAQVMGLDASGRRFGSCTALDRPVEPGWVAFDVGASYRRYHSDVNRGIFLGREPTPAERKAFACRVGANEVLDRTIKPGVSLDAALAAMKSYIEAQGGLVLEHDGLITGGHSLGLESYQRPNFAPSSSQPEFQNTNGEVVFEPGMMFTYEMPMRMPGSTTVFNVEDDVVVTDTGVENMSAMLDRDLHVKLS